MRFCVRVFYPPLDKVNELKTNLRERDSRYQEEEEEDAPFVTSIYAVHLSRFLLSPMKSNMASGRGMKKSSEEDSYYY